MAQKGKAGRQAGQQRGETKVDRKGKTLLMTFKVGCCGRGLW